MGCCGIEAIVTVDARGQLVLPKEVRDLAGIRPGEKLAVVIMKNEGRLCCLSLMKTEALSNAVRDVLAPAMQEMGVSHE
jgi:AbrB family looped-hinge helix DNA binding protein